MYDEPYSQDNSVDTAVFYNSSARGRQRGGRRGNTCIGPSEAFNFLPNELFDQIDGHRQRGRGGRGRRGRGGRGQRGGHAGRGRGDGGNWRGRGRPKRGRGSKSCPHTEPHKENELHDLILEGSHEWVDITIDEADVFRHILDYDGIISLGALADYLSEIDYKDHDVESTKKWVGRFPHKFRFATLENPCIPEEDVVTVYCRALKPCFNHMGGKGCSRDNCQYLHICRSYISGNCKFGAACRHGHDLQDRHNCSVLESVGLHIFSEEHVMAILRCSTPTVCMEYNSASGCDLGSFCTKFHVCKQYVMQKCSEDMCSLSHDFNSTQPSFLLKSFNIERLPKETQFKLMIVGSNHAKFPGSVRHQFEGSGTRPKTTKRMTDGTYFPDPEYKIASDAYDSGSRGRSTTQRRGGRNRRGRQTRNHDMVCHEVGSLPSHGSVDTKTILPALLEEPYEGKCSLKEIAHILSKVSSIPFDAMDAKRWVLQNEKHFRMLEIPSNGEERLEEAVVIVKILGLKLCFNYCSSRGCDKENPPCGYFHICRDFVAGRCERSEKGVCNYPHDIYDPHNAAMASNRDLQVLGNQLILALRSSTPRVCNDYNSSAGCRHGIVCTDVHICKDFIGKGCELSLHECSYSHDLRSEHNVRIMELFRMGKLNEGTQKKAIIMARTREQTSKTKPKFQQISKETKPYNTYAQINIKDSDANICEYYVSSRGRCKHGDDCRFHHYHLPYAWQIKSHCTGQWCLIAEELQPSIEEYYSVPFVSEVNHHGTVYNFVTMTAAADREFNTVNEGGEFRRLSTPSYCQGKQLQKQQNSFVTVWKWYWQADDGDWVLYGSDGEGPFQDVLEAKYQSKSKDCYFEKGSFAYRVDLNDMYQVNTETSKRRPILRRPVYVSPDDIKKRKFPEVPVRKFDPSKLPLDWSPMDTLSISGYDLVRLDKRTAEYRGTYSTFRKTLGNMHVVTIFRVQNLAEWEKYRREKERIDEKLEEATELNLFHGSDSIEVMKSICFQNFDPRCHGKNATAYGKGAYFAKAASYSHSYTQEQSNGYRYMFLAKVTVGRYAQGNSEMKRPPDYRPHIKYDFEMYDSCVNDTEDPSIFVIFSKSQCYPAYLIEYAVESSKPLLNKATPSPVSLPFMLNTQHLSNTSSGAHYAGFTNIAPAPRTSVASSSGRNVITPTTATSVIRQSAPKVATTVPKPSAVIPPSNTTSIKHTSVVSAPRTSVAFSNVITPTTPTSVTKHGASKTTPTVPKPSAVIPSSSTTNLSSGSSSWEDLNFDQILTDTGLKASKPVSTSSTRTLHPPQVNSFTTASPVRPPRPKQQALLHTRNMSVKQSSYVDESGIISALKSPPKPGPGLPSGGKRLTKKQEDKKCIVM